MEKFLRELESQDIHLRDRWQFELKSDIEPKENLPYCHFDQEFYIFIPDSLQINKDTYTKSQFFEDQTNFIRYKTPVFDFDELNNSKCKASPFYKLQIDNFNDESRLSAIEYELKLLGNIFRSALREESLKCYREFNKKEFSTKEALFKLSKLLENLKKFHSQLETIKKKVEEANSKRLKQCFSYVEEFIDDTTEFYLIGILYKLEKSEKFKEIAESISKYIHELKSLHFKDNGMSQMSEKAKIEYILYRRRLLNKYILDALLLSTYRYSPQSYQHIIGGIAAGIAMLFFFVLFVWQGRIFGINTMEFILVTVVLYILKDRIKEIIRTLSYKLAVRWIFDYSTEIRSHDKSIKLGQLRESFNFIHQKDLPNDIKQVREHQFHAILGDVQRLEQIILYVKSIKINFFEETHSKKMGLNNIFRLNIHDFLEKASDPEQPYWFLDEAGEKLKNIILPKIYHINIVIKNIYHNGQKDPLTEIKKYRLIVDKDGINRVESLN